VERNGRELFKVLSGNTSMPGGMRNLQKFSVCVVRVTARTRTGTSLINVRNFASEPTSLFLRILKDGH